MSGGEIDINTNSIFLKTNTHIITLKVCNELLLKFRSIFLI